MLLGMHEYTAVAYTCCYSLIDYDKSYRLNLNTTLKLSPMSFYQRIRAKLCLFSLKRLFKPTQLQGGPSEGQIGIYGRDFRPRSRAASWAWSLFPRTLVGVW